MNEEQQLPPKRRARGARTIAVTALVVLGIALFRTQVWEAHGSGDVARHRLRAVPVAPARGAILDRNGEALAETVSEYAVILLPGPREQLRGTLRELGPLLELSKQDQSRLEVWLDGPSRPLLVARGVSFDAASRIEERRSRLPHVLVELWPTRRYPHGAATASVTGSLGSAPDQGGTSRDPAGLGMARQVGVSGLELAYDELLGGAPGLRWVAVDEQGTVLEGRTDRKPEPATPGDSIRTTLDLGLQLHVANTLDTEGTGAGAAVVIDVASGGVLALHGSPHAVGADTAGPHPVVGVRRTSGALFQPVTALLGLEAGMAGGVLAVSCRGGMRYGNRYFRCWDATGHGRLAMVDALAQGCDVYFYQVGLRLGLEALLDAGTRMGLGRRTGVQLPEEQPGAFPPSVEWLREETGWPASPALALELAAGRGTNQQTLIGIATVYAMLAEGGGTRGPTLLLNEVREPAWQVDAAPETVATIRTSMEQTPASQLAAAGEWRVRGQLARWRTGTTRGTSLFSGAFGRAGGDDEIVVAVAVDRATREEAAAGIAGAIADYYLRRRDETPAAGGLAVSR